MASINDYLTGDHRHCDELLSAAEAAVDDSDWSAAESDTRGFLDAMTRHFSMEESVLFPRFEEQTGSSDGPTQMMRMEHDQMRGLFAELEDALQRREADDFLGTSETLLIMIQQHNMKEEGMLYPMADEQLAPQAAALVEDMRQVTS